MKQSCCSKNNCFLGGGGRSRKYILKALCLFLKSTEQPRVQKLYKKYVCVQ